MFISKLKIYNFRNIQEKEFIFKKKVNIFFGENGVGKTSILEAIHYLSSGKSFRKGNFKNLINFSANDFTVFVEAFDSQKTFTFAVNKTKNNQWKGKIKGKKTFRQSEITTLLPVVSIDPEIYRLVDHGPIYRRNFLDWLVFHVKHDYLSLWKKTYKCIKQLNVLYKQKASDHDLDFWEERFILYTEELTQVRTSFFELIKPEILHQINKIQPEVQKVSLAFKKGWPDNISLKEQLKLDRNNNIKFGVLQHGPHKTDIKITVANQTASHTLSRGQKKTLSIIFYMAYVKVLLSKEIQPVLCLDDFDAELDSTKLENIADFFKATDLQIFITSVLKDKVEKAFPDSQVFHVKH